jgi:hypothetical protein
MPSNKNNRTNHTERQNSIRTAAKRNAIPSPAERKSYEGGATERRADSTYYYYYYYYAYSKKKVKSTGRKDTLGVDR